MIFFSYTKMDYVNHKLRKSPKSSFNPHIPVCIGIASMNDGTKVLHINVSKFKKMGSIGIQEGEQITNAFEYATKHKLNIIMEISSSGINVTEGTVALFQMIKMSSVIKKHSDKRLLYIAIIDEFVLGGASASLVALADIVIAFPSSTYGFTGARIIENTFSETLPLNFQSSEYSLNNGQIDIITEKNYIGELLAKILSMH